MWFILDAAWAYSIDCVNRNRALSLQYTLEYRCFPHYMFSVNLSLNNKKTLYWHILIFSNIFRSRIKFLCSSLPKVMQVYPIFWIFKWKLCRHKDIGDDKAYRFLKYLDLVYLQSDTPGQATRCKLLIKDMMSTQCNITTLCQILMQRNISMQSKPLLKVIYLCCVTYLP